MYQTFKKIKNLISVYTTETDFYFILKIPNSKDECMYLKYKKISSYAAGNCHYNKHDNDNPRTYKKTLISTQTSFVEYGMKCH